MSPSTQLIQQAGLLAALGVLVLALVVVVLRLIALPLAAAVIVLDKGADLAAIPLSYSTSDWRSRR
jgi:hypothetical protein